MPLLQPLCEKTDEEVESIHDIIKILRELSSSEKIAFSSVWTAVKLLLVIPATNATSERSFSALRKNGKSREREEGRRGDRVKKREERGRGRGG